MTKKESKIKIALLTAGRSDYSIYLPLIKKLISEKHFNLHIIAFGSHPYEEFGNTIKFIEKDGFTVSYIVKALNTDFSPESIAVSMGNTLKEFAHIYNKERYDFIFALGDRFEMFAAVSASVPFNIPIAHLHGGESTLGAIDDKFRHAITLMSKYHFTSTKNHARKVTRLIDSDEFVYNVGALALDNIKDMQLLSIDELKKELEIDFTKPTLLATIHPETVNLKVNSKLVEEFIRAIELSEYQTLITLPNNDTANEFLRKELIKFSKTHKNIFAFDALGPLKYYSCMKHCYAVIGNSSSGIIEAASFGKYVINIGDRQKGRDRGENIIDTPIDATAIKSKIEQAKEMPELNKKNNYGEGNTSDKIISIIKKNSKSHLT
ncbi:MAG: UDP-N-acetylglucosamine 2-epimerase [Melioribacteraceae bacterium]|nr:UDP-N-acetylglucosamine 2-epimerase [Saprospiraceae bacterium]MCF8355750.1 UDP-N-acetylglucosamine 2-epimerase [Melioribacteraceae bacterium]MCF8394778.1 UDP-N-acetylglucosamine 2-epimerase [Melioribacteraceae bacterium]